MFREEIKTVFCSFNASICPEKKCNSIKLENQQQEKFKIAWNWKNSKEWSNSRAKNEFSEHKWLIFDVRKRISVISNKSTLVDANSISFKHFHRGGKILNKMFVRIYNISIIHITIFQGCIFNISVIYSIQNSTG